MKICVVGAGAIGGLLAVKLAQAGEEVAVVARGAHLAAIRRDGLKLLADGGEQVARVRATDRIRDVGPQELVILALKAHQIAPVVGDLGAVMAPGAPVVTAQNGIPWWYFFKHGGPHEGTHLESVDPGGRIAEHLDVGRVIGSIIYPAAEVVAPGVVQHIEGNRVTLGELDGAESERLRLLADLFRRAGFRSRLSSDIRSEIWVKLWGNCTFNPVSALTHATLADICRFPLTRALAASMMGEAQGVGQKLGVKFTISLEKRIAGAEGVGAHKTSMLQDVESGRQMELDALVGSVIELGRLTGTPTPHLDSVYACASLLVKTLKDAGGRVRVERLV
jgi:2-dehydropantoate 2-reductase